MPSPRTLAVLRRAAFSALALTLLGTPLMARDVKGALAMRERIALPPTAGIVVEVRSPEAVIAEFRQSTNGAQAPLSFSLDVPEGKGQVLRGAILIDGRPEWLSEAVVLPESGDVDLGILWVVRHVVQSFPSQLDCGGAAAVVGFSGEDTAVLTVGTESVALRLMPLPTAVPGVRFSNGATPETTIWLDEDRARIVLQGEALPECVPVAASLALPFVARGNEPGWVLNVTDEGASLSREDGGGAIGGPLSGSAENEAGIRYTVSDGLAFTVQPGLCHDTMTGLPYPATVLVDQEGEMLNGCGGDPRDLIKGDWRATRIGEADVPAAIEVSLSFEGDRVAGRSGCNRYNGAVEMTGEGLRFGPVAGTMMACPDEAMAVERAFHEALAAVDRFDIGAEGELLLIGGDKTLLTARR